MECAEVAVNEEDPWEKFDRDMEEGSKFFRPEIDIGYAVVVEEAELAHKPFKEGDPPKWTATIKFKTVDGQPCDKVWETRSIPVIKKLRMHKKKGTLADTKFMLKKKKEGDKTRYVFEEMPED